MELAVPRRDLRPNVRGVDCSPERGANMKFAAIVHEAEEGGYWAEVPSLPGCATQGDTLEELLQNLLEAIGGCLD